MTRKEALERFVAIHKRLTALNTEREMLIETRAKLQEEILGTLKDDSAWQNFRLADGSIVIVGVSSPRIGTRSRFLYVAEELAP